MADFCRQCSIEEFGEDFGDHARPGEILPDDRCYYVICEGCGIVGVNEKGECLTPDCLQKHGTKDWQVKPYETAGGGHE